MRRNKLEICLHFVWATWDRLPLITAEIEREVYRCLEQACRAEECEVLAVGGMPDHVHLLLLSHNTVTAATLMNHVKGSSSRFVTDTLRPGQWFAWQANYGCFSISRSHRQKVICYIENQKQHYANDDLWPDAEETSETF